MRLPNEPVRNTCPDINRLQKTIKEIRDNFASFKEEDNIEELSNTISAKETEIGDLEDRIDELENNIIEIQEQL